MVWMSFILPRNLCSLQTQRFPHQLWTVWTGGSVISSAGPWHEARETVFSEQTLVPAKEEISIRGAAVPGLESQTGIEVQNSEDVRFRMNWTRLSHDYSRELW